jgi:hypothetical protein
MKSLTAQTTLFTTLSQNSSTANQSLGQILINDNHRYLIQKYFDNERSFTMTTVGPQTLTLTATPKVGDTTATLSATWPYNSCQQLVVFGDSEQRTVFFTQGSANIYWQNGTGLIGSQFSTTAVIPSGATSATLVNVWPTASQSSIASFSDGSTKTITFTQNSANISWTGGLAEGVQAYVNVFPTNTSISCVGVQSYRLPANISKLKTSTITIGQLVYTSYPVNSVAEWVRLNALPYNAAYPAYFFVFNDELQFYPIPSTTGYVITLYAQINVADMTYADYTTGTISGASVGSNAITGTSTSWNTTGHFPLNVDLTFANLFLQITPPNGDGLYYQIQSFQSDTTLTLVKPIINAPNISSANYTIGQYPLLQGDFHDIPVYWALKVYFSSIAKDTDKAGLYDGIMANKLNLMESYLSTKQVNVDLGRSPVQRNANLYPYPVSSNI